LKSKEKTMSARTVTMELPEKLYLRLQQTAQAPQQSFEAIVLRALQVGSPPAWESAPAEFQTDLAALDRLDDAAFLVAHGSLSGHGRSDGPLPNAPR
jgi:hypothetical protein